MSISIVRRGNQPNEVEICEGRHISNGTQPRGKLL